MNSSMILKENIAIKASINATNFTRLAMEVDSS